MERQRCCKVCAVLAVILGIISLFVILIHLRSVSKDALSCKILTNVCHCSSTVPRNDLRLGSSRTQNGEQQSDFEEIQTFELMQVDAIRCWASTNREQGFVEHLPARFFDLDLSDNRIVDIENGFFQKLSFLKIITLNGNRLSSFHRDWFYGLMNLSNLSMASNVMTEWTGFDQTPSAWQSRSRNEFMRLRHLDIGFNRFTSLEGEVLRHFQHLEYFNAESNYINYIGRHAFGRWKNLRVLILRGNKLKTPHAEWLKAASDIDISDNPWKCDREVLRYLHFHDEHLAAREKTSSITRNITCFSPTCSESLIVDHRVRECIRSSHCTCQEIKQNESEVSGWTFIILSISLLLILPLIFWLAKSVKAWLHRNKPVEI